MPNDWPSGEYTLKETKAPAGFKIGTESYTININQEKNTIKSNGKTLYSKTGETEVLNALKIINERGTYPSTGGIGTMIFTGSGLLMMAIAFIEYRKRREVG